MQIEFFGANCIRIKTKSVSVVFDDNLKQLGSKSITTSDDVSCNTNSYILKVDDKAKISFDTPGEYEVGDVILSGISAQAHTDDKNTQKAVIYRGIVGDFRFVVLGHIAPHLSEEQLEAIGVVDIAFIPVGNQGYTLDAVAAAQIAKQLEAKLVIPTHFDGNKLNYEVPQTSYEEFAKIMGEARKVEGRSLKVKRSDLLEKQEVIVFTG